MLGTQDNMVALGSNSVSSLWWSADFHEVVDKGARADPVYCPNLSLL